MVGSEDIEMYKNSLISSINNGILLIMADGKIIETKDELENYKMREDKGEKFFFTMQYIPNRMMTSQ